MESNKKYLGNHLFIRRNKNLSFEGLINQIKSKIDSRQIPLLSQASRNRLIKSVASAIPVYNMYVLHLPTDMSDIINKMLKSIWWGRWGRKEENSHCKMERAL